MARLFSFASWNVEHFHGEPAHAARVVEVVASRDPDVFAIFEVQGKDVYAPFMARMPGHSFFLTENMPGAGIEILVGVRRTLPSFVTQRGEFQSQVPTLRPGAIATIHVAGTVFTLLFLHVKSFPDPRSWGLRDDMFHRVAGLKRTLDRVMGDDAPAKFLCLGDLNTMGLNATYNEVSDLTPAQEIRSLGRRLSAAGMRPLRKSHDETWWNGGTSLPPSALDHVYASDELSFTDLGGFEVEVVGWPQLPDDASRRRWIEEHSDHAMLYGEVAE